MIGREHRFGTRIAQGTIPSWFSVFWAAVSGCSRNRYGTSPNLWVQKKFIKLGQSTQNASSIRLNSLESFLVSLPSISSKTWEMYSWAIPGSSVFCHWLFLVFSGVSLETAANFLLFFKVAMILGESCQLWRLYWILIIQQRRISRLIMRETVQSKQTVNAYQENYYSTKGYKII